MRSGPILSVLFAVLAAFSCISCSGPSAQTKKTLNNFLAQELYADAEAHLQKVKEKEYGPKNAVLYNLDMGTILHHQGRYKESDSYLDKAETRMQELYTKSVTKAAGTLLINDNTMDYAGEPFERALTNVLRALNYVFMGQPEEALVESRKVEVFLEELGARMGKRRVYRDDAFARALDSLLYADAGKNDDSRISLEAAEAAYGWYASEYNTPKPTMPSPRLKGDDGEVVFIHYNGVAPRKINKTFQVAWNQALVAVKTAKEEGDPQAADPKFANALRAAVAQKAITVAYPEYVQDPVSITLSEISAENASADTILMEDISAIAFKDLKDRMAVIRSRAIARAMVKFILAKAATDAAESKYGKNSWQSIMTKVTTNVASAASEIADTRGWSTLPSQIRVARLPLSPGRHDLSVLFKDAAGTTLKSHKFKDVVVKKGRRTYLHYRTAL